MFKCDKCSKEFKRKCDYSRHVNIGCNLINCLECGKTTKNPKFCSRSCSAAHTTRGRKHSLETREKISNSLLKRTSSYKEEINKKTKFRMHSYCLNCNSVLPRGRKYCNYKCQNKKKYKDFITDWLKNPDKYNCPSAYMKKYLIEKYNNSCSRCGWNKKHPVRNTVPLEMHHRDGNWRNNNPNNLDLVCPNCHSLTITYRIGNKGNGRKKQREYYRGKTTKKPL